MVKWELSGLVLVAACSLALPAFGQADDAGRAAVREIAEEGLAAFDAGKFDEATAKLGRAFDAMQVPTLGLWLARALVKTGRLVEASERYGEVTRLEPQPGQQTEIQKQAQADAAAEQQELRKRIPRIRVDVQGADAEDVEVTVSGAKVPSSMLGAPRPVNPGKCLVRGKRGSQVVTQEVTLAEGENRAVVLRFQQAGPAPAGPASPPTSPPDQGTSRGSLQRTAGWIGLGVGAAGLAVGGIAGLMALGAKSKLDDGGCDDGHCYLDQSSDVDPYNSKVTISTIGFVVGGVGLAAGAVLLLTSPRTESSKPEVMAYFGPGRAGLAGSF
jgi:hypothetical protein